MARRSKAEKLIAIIEATVTPGRCVNACQDGAAPDLLCSTGCLRTQRGVVKMMDPCPWGTQAETDWTGALDECPCYEDSVSGDDP